MRDVAAAPRGGFSEIKDGTLGDKTVLVLVQESKNSKTGLVIVDDSLDLVSMSDERRLR